MSPLVALSVLCLLQLSSSASLSDGASYGGNDYGGDQDNGTDYDFDDYLRSAGYGNSPIAAGKRPEATPTPKSPGFQQSGSGYADLGSATAQGSGYAAGATSGTGYAAGAASKSSGYAAGAASQTGYAAGAASQGSGFAASAASQGSGYAAGAASQGSGYPAQGTGYDSGSSSQGASSLPPQGAGYGALPGVPIQPIPPNMNQLIPKDPNRGLAYLEYLYFLLANYPSCKGQCDLSSFSQCTCVSPALFTPDGRGNCNLGVTKADSQVWCYVSEDYGHPSKVCPDARESTTRPGYFWSRVACITE